MIQRFNESERSDEAKNLMRHLLNEPVINNTGWPDYNKKVKRETNLRSDSRPYLNAPTYDSLTYNGPIYDDKGQAKCFSSRSLLTLPTLSSKYVTNQFRIALARRTRNWAWACLHWLLTRQTRMAVVPKVILSLMHKITLSMVRMELTRFILLVVYTDPTRLLPLSGWTSSLWDLLPLFGA